MTSFKLIMEDGCVSEYVSHYLKRYTTINMLHVDAFQLLVQNILRPMGDSKDWSKSKTR